MSANTPVRQQLSYTPYYAASPKRHVTVIIEKTKRTTMCADRCEHRSTVGRRNTIGYISYVPGAKLEKGAITEHGRPDRNTNARQLSERKGSSGTVQSDRNTGELATKKHGSSGKIERRSTVRVVRQVWVQRAARSKRVARKKPIP